MQFSFRVYDAVTIRSNPTTQVGITIDGWPGNTFMLWFPEVVGDLWQQWNPPVAHQDFTTTDRGGLRWTYEGNPAASIQSELTPQANSLLLVTRVMNRGHDELKHVYAQNCIHFSQAPGFICDDYSRFYIRSAGQWRSLASLKPTSGFPRYYREGYPSRGRIDPTEHQFGDIRQETPVDHPLMVLISQDGKRAVGVASERYEFLFHNQMEYLRCIHSESGCMPILPAGQTAEFREKIYFVEGGLKECVAAFERDVQWDQAGEFSFRG
ncbi:MAG: hypothetical protein HZB26_06030 [Candidatus Hydrogenedentes bacterium]|nr:hypothetical protein [Candidatus Hydrogenedentota bacterium]